VALINRSADRAMTLATAWGAAPYCWEALPGLLDDADLVMVATGASRPVLSAEQLSSALSRRPTRMIVVMDLGVPRNVEPSARRLHGVRLFDLDDLQRMCCPAAGTPAEALRDAERMLGEEMGRLEIVLRGRAAAPKLAELHRLGAQMAEQEATWALSQLDDLTDRERGVVREMADRLVRRVLYPVSRSLRQE
jgi:glutamyl-tRNA reductase